MAKESQLVRTSKRIRELKSQLSFAYASLDMKRVAQL